MNLKKYAQENEFSKGLPEGKTVFDTNKCTVKEETITEDDGTKRTTWKIDNGDKESYVPATVMTGIKKAIADGKESVEVVRNGVGLQTKYTVTGV